MPHPIGGSTALDKINSLFALRTKKRRMKEAVEYCVDIMTEGNVASVMIESLFCCFGCLCVYRETLFV